MLVFREEEKRMTALRRCFPFDWGAGSSPVDLSGHFQFITQTSTTIKKTAKMDTHFTVFILIMHLNQQQTLSERMVFLPLLKLVQYRHLKQRAFDGSQRTLDQDALIL